jgi:hypothetical protein
MTVSDAIESVAARYRTFAAVDIGTRSPLYRDLCLGIADDGEVLALLAALPGPKRQPNLLLGSVRYRYGTPATYGAFRSLVVDHWDVVREVILARRTQTNEVARCATLLPLLARLPPPLALLEVGSSAGLCLLLDHYRYDYGAAQIGPADSQVLLRCETRGATPVPTAVPAVAWRAGLDLEPLDVADPDSARWLEALVWPGEGDRLARLDAAIATARRHPPTLTRGDLTRDLATVAAGAPEGATLVVFHSATLAYVDLEGRHRFVSDVRRLGATWIANESPGVVPSLTDRLDAGESERHDGDFLLSCDGEPVAWTDHHGAWVEWR